MAPEKEYEFAARLTVLELLIGNLLAEAMRPWPDASILTWRDTVRAAITDNARLPPAHLMPIEQRQAIIDRVAQQFDALFRDIVKTIDRQRAERAAVPDH